jgi:hypothetical protein
MPFKDSQSYTTILFPANGRQGKEKKKAKEITKEK